ncbi:alkaline phosphatase family protein [Pelomonas sp. Root1237]|uniref:alkaline phosphatase family protein n=1 Tax=Pelomonas sp. Root1237 TaxID=1736434 RepID=UPI0006F1FBD9|nr:alkaline phosphatase family protein [Pelomonas sp. Root1237]KQV96573.1 hypothetical protein ASC91_03245 [Pelomonas sp. Root1237]
MPVRHVFVLMLENRSFDHFFGLSGRVPRPADPRFGPGATDRASADPPHEFDAVRQQINGGAMDGFQGIAWQGFKPEQVPVIQQLADEFLLFDNWFSSLPGPTWPNRFFVHAASSGGLATSPTNLQIAGSVIASNSVFRFEHGTLFDRLNQRSQPWRIYHGDVVPQVLALPGMASTFIKPNERFHPFSNGDEEHPVHSDFATDVAHANYAPVYTFIEPAYDPSGSFGSGNSQHPLGRVSAGEALIKSTYESLRNSPLWPDSLLLITWDEHGGFYDREPPPGATPPGATPPGATPPGDAPLNRPTPDVGFAFDRLGVRVPALLVSPWVARGSLGSQVFPGQSFDHSSVVRSVFDTFGLGPALTARDAAAPSWTTGLLPAARQGADAGPLTLADPVRDAAPAAAPPHRDEVDGFLAGRALIAHELDRTMTAASGDRPVGNLKPLTPAQFRAKRKAALNDPEFPSHVAQYVQEVGARAQAHRDRVKRKAKR